LEKYVRELLAEIKNETGLPGLSVALSIDGAHLVVSAGVLTTDQGHPFSNNARFQLGCITKLLTSLTGSALIHQERSMQTRQSALT